MRRDRGKIAAAARRPRAEGGGELGGRPDATDENHLRIRKRGGADGGERLVGRGRDHDRAGHPDVLPEVGLRESSDGRIARRRTGKAHTQGREHPGDQGGSAKRGRGGDALVTHPAAEVAGRREGPVPNGQPTGQPGLRFAHAGGIRPARSGIFTLEGHSTIFTFWGRR